MISGTTAAGLATTLLIAATAAPVAASGTATRTHSETAFVGEARMTYELFEHTVDHADLETCPEDFDPEAVFCRMTLAGGSAHVFVFSHDRDQPLLAVRTFDPTRGFLPF